MIFIWSDGVYLAAPLDEQIDKLKKVIADLEAQRSILGDEAVDAAPAPSKRKLAEVEAKVADSKVEQPEIPERQRKLVTLRYMDVVESTAITRDLEPQADENRPAAPGGSASSPQRARNLQYTRRFRGFYKIQITRNMSSKISA